MFNCRIDKPEDDEIKTYNYHEHKPFLRRGADAVDVFCHKLHEIRDCIQKTMQENYENRENDEDKEDFKNATRCFICGDRSQKSCKTEKETDQYQKVRDKGQSPSSYPSEKYQKVRNHCRFTGR